MNNNLKIQIFFAKYVVVNNTLVQFLVEYANYNPCHIYVTNIGIALLYFITTSYTSCIMIAMTSLICTLVDICIHLIMSISSFLNASFV